MWCASYHGRNPEGNCVLRTQALELLGMCMCCWPGVPCGCCVEVFLIEALKDGVLVHAQLGEEHIYSGSGFHSCT